MEIDLAEAVGEGPNQARQARFRHRPAPAQAEHLIGDRHPGPADPGAGQGRPDVHDRITVRPRARLRGHQRCERLDRNAHGGQTIAGANLKD